MKQRQAKKIYWEVKNADDKSRVFTWYGCIDNRNIIGIQEKDHEFVGTFLSHELCALTNIEGIITSNDLEELKLRFQCIVENSVDKAIDTLEFVSEEKE
ncbi:hypothetical protein LCGC14_1415070 [marine sediment metagenome]|uniref:Uncharacterized protein n=1 Tax=marine sediment metagenome TaxID=412755 RepID=A0A0F9MUT1_9ZZZZ